VTAGIARAAAVALLAEILLVIGQPSANPLVFACQVAASAFLAGVLAAGLRSLRARAGRPRADEAAPADGGPS
jgi:peptidoglycan/LPS O-acetylase OafA/YrhL